MRVVRGEFQLSALFAALDAKRQAQRLTWSALAREVSRPFTNRGSRPVAVSTITGLGTKAVAEGDGVLQMLRWLERSPESFVPGLSEEAWVALPNAGPGLVLRFETRRLHAALDRAREARGLAWRELAREVGSTPASLTGLSNGGRTGFPYVMRLTRWLDAPVAQFVRVTSR